jgi:uncharacterized membrane protein YkvA (DUF1232 family)
VDARPLLALVVGLLAAWVVLVAILWVLRPRDARLSELLRVIPDVARLVRDLLPDRRVPLTVRLALVGLLVWLLNPIDLIPEFIPVLGPLDDVVVAIIVLRYVRSRLGDDELRRRWRGTDDGLRLVYAVL